MLGGVSVESHLALRYYDIASYPLENLMFMTVYHVPLVLMTLICNSYHRQPYYF